MELPELPIIHSRVSLHAQPFLHNVDIWLSKCGKHAPTSCRPTSCRPTSKQTRKVGVPPQFGLGKVSLACSFALGQSVHVPAALQRERITWSPPATLYTYSSHRALDAVRNCTATWRAAGVMEHTCSTTGCGARKRCVRGPPGLSVAHLAATAFDLSAGMLLQNKVTIVDWPIRMLST